MTIDLFGDDPDGTNNTGAGNPSPTTPPPAQNNPPAAPRWQQPQQPTTGQPPATPPQQPTGNVYGGGAQQQYPPQSAPTQYIPPVPPAPPAQTPPQAPPAAPVSPAQPTALTGQVVHQQYGPSFQAPPAQEVPKISKLGNVGMDMFAVIMSGVALLFSCCCLPVGVIAAIISQITCFRVWSKTGTKDWMTVTATVVNIVSILIGAICFVWIWMAYATHQYGA